MQTHNSPIKAFQFLICNCLLVWSGTRCKAFDFRTILSGNGPPKSNMDTQNDGGLEEVTPLKMAILGIYVRFLACTSQKKSGTIFQNAK